MFTLIEKIKKKIHDVVVPSNFPSYFFRYVSIKCFPTQPIKWTDRYIKDRSTSTFVVLSVRDIEMEIDSYRNRDRNRDRRREGQKHRERLVWESDHITVRVGKYKL